MEKKELWPGHLETPESSLVSNTDFSHVAYLPSTKPPVSIFAKGDGFSLIALVLSLKLFTYTVNH